MTSVIPESEARRLHRGMVVSFTRPGQPDTHYQPATFGPGSRLETPRDYFQVVRVEGGVVEWERSGPRISQKAPHWWAYPI